MPCISANDGKGGNPMHSLVAGVAAGEGRERVSAPEEAGNRAASRPTQLRSDAVGSTSRTRIDSGLDWCGAGEELVAQCNQATRDRSRLKYNKKESLD